MASQNIGSSVALASAAAVVAVLYSSGGGAWEQLAQYLSSADKKAVIIIGMCAMFFAQALLLQAYMIFPFYVMEGVERPGFLSRVFFYWVCPLSQKGDLDLEALQGSAPDATHTGAAAAGRPYSLPAFRAELRRCWGGGQLAEGYRRVKAFTLRYPSASCPPPQHRRSSARKAGRLYGRPAAAAPVCVASGADPCSASRSRSPFCDSGQTQ
jgi:hypothetical protein